MIAGARKETQCRIPEILIRSKFVLGPGNSTERNQTSAFTRPTQELKP